MKRFLPLLLILLILSCSRSTFQVSGASFQQNEEGIRVLVYTEDEGEDESFSFILTSPEGDLSWEGKLDGNRGSLYSDYLLITPGAQLPKGTYSIVIHSNTGSDVIKELVL